MSPAPNAYGAERWGIGPKKAKRIRVLCQLRTRAGLYQRLATLQWKTGTDAMTAGRLLGQFRISSAMHPYVLRVRLRGSDFDFGATPERAAAFTKSIGKMRRILLEKGRVRAIAADRAILKTLTGQTQLKAADAKRIWRGMVEIESEKTKRIRLLCRLHVPAGLY
jgi:hypothetical protein